MAGSRRPRAPSRSWQLLALVALVLWVVLVHAVFATDVPADRKSSCSDVSPACIDLAARCDDPATHTLLRLACPVTCSACSSPVPADFDCRDRRGECRQIASAGRCDARPLTFWRDCSLSCRVCTPRRGLLDALGAAPAAAPATAVQTAAEPCQDERADCAARASAGECLRGPGRAQMVLECAASCDTCQRRQQQAAAGDGSADGVRPSRAHRRRRGLRRGRGRGRSGGCFDRRRSCEYWVSVGECEEAPEAMELLCAASCGLCSQSDEERTPPAEQRVACDDVGEDKHEDCDEWAAAGECEASPRHMRSKCACACRQPRAVAAAALAAAATAAAASTARGGGAGGGGCVDAHERCGGWAYAGVCKSSPVPMRRLCPVACGMCGGAGRAAAAAALEAEEDIGATAGEAAAGEASGSRRAAVSPQMHLQIERWCREAQEAARAGGTSPVGADGQRVRLRAAPLVRGVALSAIRLSADSAFHDAQQLNTEYLLELELDRLLWSFRKTAGLPAPAKPYGAWEAAEGYPDPLTPTRTLRGHFVGHYLSGLALAYASSGDERLSARAAELVSELSRCQAAYGSGFLSAWPEAVLDALEAGSFSEVWAPWYTLHKILAGLLDAHAQLPKLAADGGALRAAQWLCSYLEARVARVRRGQGEEWWQATLEVEFGGIGEAAYRLASLSEPRSEAAEAALRLARAFHKKRFIEPLAAGQDSLKGLHANTHLPLLVHAARGAEVEGSDALLSAPVHGYCTLQLGYAYAGALGSSVNEHWPRTAGSTGGATRVLFAPDEDTEDLVGGCADLADAGECERSVAYMRAHCAASCADARRSARGGGGAADAGAGVSDVAADSDAFHTQESCTQYNALKLNLELFSRGPHAALADAFERKLLNGVLGIQHPGHPGKMIYMMPLGAGVSKERANWAGFGGPDDAFWCCYGTGVESFAKLADGAFFESEPGEGAPGEGVGGEGGEGIGAPALWVSQFVPSTLRWAGGGAVVTLTRELDGDTCAAMRITLALQPAEAGPEAGPRLGCFSPRGCTLWLRLPSWADPAASSVHLASGLAAGAAVRPGDALGERLEPAAAGDVMAVGRFLRVHRSWRAGDGLAACFGMYAYLEPLNDWRPQYASTYALLYGPMMLVGLTERGEQTLRGSPAAVREWTNVTRCLPRRDGDVSAAWSELRLVGPGVGERDVELMALADVVEQTYTAYFKLQ